MHIKQITISNFRSFKQQPEIHPFSPGTNSVVGRNGSGKSNLFDAVQFVLLSPRFYSLRAEERQALLHEGSGSAAVNAFVEVVFDNSDNRFSLENSDEVVLRRTVGPKKDEFFLQRKRATKQEISSLLEGAGFSKSNPYFMIQQGKIQDICTMTDSQRLALLKQVAGTTVYDEKKQESLMKMEENNSSIEKIHGILQDIEERLQELHGEKEELTTYQQLDRKRRAMEYTLYDKELRRARAALETVEADRARHVEASSELNERSRQTHDSIQHVEAAIKTKTHTLRRNAAQLTAQEANKTAAVKKHTALDLCCRELRDTIKASKKADTANQRELEQVEKDILKVQKELDKKVDPEYQQAYDDLQRLNQQRDQNKRQMDGLVAKKGRGGHFSTKAERDKYLKTTIKEIEVTLVEKEATLGELRESLAHVRRTATQDAASLQSMTAEIEQKQQTLQEMKKNVDSLKNERMEAHQKKNERWRQTEEINDRMMEAKEAMHRALEDARKVMPRATAWGLEALDKMDGIVDQERLIKGEQYFGMVMDNFALRDAKYSTAVEVAAQNSLFHVIVDTDATAARLMKRLEDGKLGRVTFLPLNRLRVEDVRYPQATGIKPLISHCLEYDPKVARAMEHVFSRKLLAQTAEMAAQWSTKAGMDAISLEGDLCSRKGALTGGYVDASKSRMKAHENQARAWATLQDLQREHHESKARCHQVEQKATELNRKLQQQESKHTEFTKMIRQQETTARNLQKKIDSKKNEADKLEREKIPPLELEVSGLQSDVKRLQDEMKTELTSTLSEAEKKELNDLKEAEKALKNDIEKQTDRVSEISLMRQQLLSKLNDNLFRRQSELKGMSQGGNNDDDEDADGNATSLAALIAEKTDELLEKEQELEDAERVMQEMDERLEELRQAESKIRGEISAQQAELEKHRSQDAQNQKELEAGQETAERLMNKRQMHISKRETYSTKIQELGALPPPSEREGFQSKSITDLMKSLEAVNKKLKKYSHVNKKAFDQFVNFSEQRDALLRRKDELDRSAQKVKELVDNLDEQKNAAIHRTFKGVKRHFVDVFKELVPNGAGKLKLLVNGMDDPDTDDEDDDDDDNEEEAENPDAHSKKTRDVEAYRGIQIKVRFSPIGENFMMSQLSGGQKTLVALALIFSIQRCDPAPFYLFDELDQALDPSYRAAVASLIQKRANHPQEPTQFIVSTFRPELVQIANRCYGISHQNKESNFHHLGKKESLEFIANLNVTDEAVMEVTALESSRVESRKRKAADNEPADESTAGTPQVAH